MAEYDDAYVAALSETRKEGDLFDRDRHYIEPVSSTLPVGSPILDVATGVSRIPERLSALGYSPYGIDLNEVKNSKNRGSCNGVFVQADAKNMPFESGTFAGVIAKDILEHFRIEDEVRIVLEEINRVLEKDGILVVGCPSKTIPSKLLKLLHKLKDPSYNAVDDTGDETHKNWFSESELQTTILQILTNFKHIQTKHIMFGRHNFPKHLITPLAHLQNLLQSNLLANTDSSKLIQKTLAFRVIEIFRKVA